jgi:hypothetical protein
MSLAELKAEVEKLSPEERLKLAALLADLDEQSEDEFRAGADRRMTAMDNGRKITAEEFERRHQQRQSEGR